MIGAFELLLNQPSTYLYRTTYDPVDTFFLRRSSLKQISHNPSYKNFKRFALFDYIKDIYFPIKNQIDDSKKHGALEKEGQAIPSLE